MSLWCQKKFFLSEITQQDTASVFANLFFYFYGSKYMLFLKKNFAKNELGYCYFSLEFFWYFWNTFRYVKKTLTNIEDGELHNNSQRLKVLN